MAVAGPAITLYGFGKTRSARCEWTLLELGVDFEFVNDQALFHSAEVRNIHPQGKLPALMIDGEPLFESVAICTHLCDVFGGHDLIAAPGTIERARHEQWCAFTLSEMDAYLWSNFKHQSLYPQEKRVASIIEPNNEEFRNGAKAVDDVLSRQPYMLGQRFTVTDVIVGWTINWGRRMEQLSGLDNLLRYLDRLFAREHCTLNPD